MKRTLALATLLGLALGFSPGQAQQVTTLIQFTNVWRYDQSGLDPGTAWRTNSYADPEWASGMGLLGAEPNTPMVYTVHAPISTPLIISSTVTTYFFRTTFNFAGTTNGLSLVASNLVDDGFVMYLNGRESGRARVPANQNAATMAVGGPASEGLLEATSMTNLALLREGENLIAVEVHQAGQASSDVMWGMKLMAIQQTALVITNQPQSQTVTVGDPVTFTVGVSGGPATYRWLKGDVLQSSTSNSLHISSAQPASAGDYRVIISNAVSAVTSSVAALTVIADVTGPKLVAAVGHNTPVGGSPLPANSINVLFSELITNTPDTVRNTNNYVVTRLGTSNTVPATSAQYSTALGAFLLMDTSDPDWVYGGDYVLTVSNVRDRHGNVIAPGSQVTVSWPHSTNLIRNTDVWDFHASAIFEPEVFDEDWFACDYAPSFWWAQGQGIFYGGVLADNPCLPLGTLQTQTGFQPEPVLYRTAFQWPTHWPSSGTFRIATTYDDGLVLYLDGKELYGNNAGTAGSPVGLTTKAPSALSVCVTNLSVAVSDLRPGFHCLAAAILQADTPASADSVFALRMDATAYIAPALPEQSPAVLSLTPLDANSARLSWIGGGYALESTTNLSLGPASHPLGPWQQVTNMSNPYTITPDELQRFYRLKK